MRTLRMEVFQFEIANPMKTCFLLFFVIQLFGFGSFFLLNFQHSLAAFSIASPTELNTYLCH
jgi:hypothetical protein